LAMQGSMSLHLSKTLGGSWRGKAVRGVEWTGPLCREIVNERQKGGWCVVFDPLLCRCRRRDRMDCV